MKCRLSLLLACVAGVISTPAEIVIEGTVRLPPPKLAAATTGRYQQKSGAVAAPQPAVAVVYLEGAFAGESRQAAAVEVKQENFQFAPAVLPIQKGTAVEFPNHDDDYHHVFSYSKAKEFDLGRYRKTEKPAPVRFDKPGVVKVGCEIHDHMRAIILVLDTPHFTTTDADGKYRLALPDLPAGTYVLKTWVNEKTVWEQTIDLKPGGTLQVHFPRS